MWEKYSISKNGIMDGMEIFKQDVCRAALECNANLVVVYNGTAEFGFRAATGFSCRIP